MCSRCVIRPAAGSFLNETPRSSEDPSQRTVGALCWGVTLLSSRSLPNLPTCMLSACELFTKRTVGRSSQVAGVQLDHPGRHRTSAPEEVSPSLPCAAADVSSPKTSRPAAEEPRRSCPPLWERRRQGRSSLDISVGSAPVSSPTHRQAVAGDSPASEASSSLARSKILSLSLPALTKGEARSDRVTALSPASRKLGPALPAGDSALSQLRPSPAQDMISASPMSRRDKAMSRLKPLQPSPAHSAAASAERGTAFPLFLPSLAHNSQPLPKLSSPHKSRGSSYSGPQAHAS